MTQTRYLVPVAALTVILLSCVVFPGVATGALTAHLMLDETSGTTAADETGNGHDGALLGGPVWAGGKIDGGLRLDGQNDRISIPSGPLGMESWTQLTVSAWVKNDIGAGAGTDDIVTWWNWTGYPCTDCSLGLTHHRNDQYFFQLGNAWTSGGTVGTDWTLVVGTYDGSMIRLYVDGVLVDSASYSGGIPYSSANLLIGTQGDLRNYFDGTVDDVRIYDDALTSQSIVDLFNQGSPPPDATPPSQPQNLATIAIGMETVDLIWDAAVDLESGISHYIIYRNGAPVGQSPSVTFGDSGLDPFTTYRYEVSAVNTESLESARSPFLDVETLADTSPPVIQFVQAGEDDLVIGFDEDLDPSSAQIVANYAIDNGVTISSAVLGADDQTVMLVTSPHVEGTVYTVSVSGVQDIYGNAIVLETRQYSALLTDPSLQGWWKLDDGSGPTAADATDNGNPGTLMNGPVWTGGGIDGAVIFDGQNDYIVVDADPLMIDTWSEITVGAWVKNDIGPGAGTDDIIGQWDYPSSRSWILTHHGNNQYFWEISGKSFISGGAVSTDWTHVMGTYDGSMMRLFVNGSEVASQTGLSGPLPSSNADLVIASQDNLSNFFDGIVDDLRIYDRSLDATEIQNLVATSNPGDFNVPPTVVANANPTSGVAPLAVEFTANANDIDGYIVSYSWDFDDTGSSTDPNPMHTYLSTGVFVAQVTVTDNKGATGTDSVTVTVNGAPGGPTDFQVWYGPQQSFGNIGLAQTFANVLGNVSDPDGIQALYYSLNGGPNVDLSLGPDLRRLRGNGDFNVDLGVLDLLVGQNTLMIGADDLTGESSFAAVNLDYDDSNVWPLPYALDWSSVSEIQEGAQIVDGRWENQASGLRILEPGYDRVVGVGDLGWVDYEISVPITVHGYDPDVPYPSGSAGFGITLRWRGHTDDPVTCPQPHCGWLPSGAGAWYDMGHSGPLRLDGQSDSSVDIQVGDTVIWKFRVETNENGPLYSLKVWQSDESEPGTWNLQRQRGPSDVASGSAIIIAHHVDLTVGDISVVPVGESVPDTTPPAVVSVRAENDQSVRVVYSEPVEPGTATDLNNYVIDNGISVFGATLEPSGQEVVLATSTHVDGVSYMISISGVEDLAMPPNVMSLEQVQYSLVVLQYLFDEVSGTVAGDSSGNGYDGTLVNGPAWTTDPARGAVIQMDGLDDYVATDSNPIGIDSWTELTVAAWVKNDVGVGAGADDIVTWWRWTGYPCTDCSFTMTHHNNDQYFFQLGDTWVNGGTVSTDWRFVVGTYDGSTIRLYVDGALVDSGSYSGGIPYSSADLLVGTQGDLKNYFDGRIDNVEIFDTALSAAEISDRYLGTMRAGLHAHSK